MAVFKHESHYNFSLDEVFEYHLRPSALYRMIAPWQKVRVLSKTGTPENENSGAILEVTKWGIPFKWEVKHRNYHYLTGFEDYQVKGPFKKWEHKHSFKQGLQSQTVLEDVIEYETPFHIGEKSLERELKRAFHYRYQTLKNDLYLYKKYPLRKKRILISGTSGFVGSHLKVFFENDGHEVITLNRGEPKSEFTKDIYWNYRERKALVEQFENFDVIIHLAGESLSAGLWSIERKNEIYNSRVVSTHFLCDIIAQLKHPPKTILGASAIGYYGSSPKEKNEYSDKGEGFLSDVCRDWEESWGPVRKKGVRVALLRLGVVIGGDGGLIKTLLPSFKMGLGARLGTGKQHLSWISIDDVIGGVYHILKNTSIDGAINFTTPHPVRNEELVHSLAHRLHRSSWLRIPRALLNAVDKELAEEFLTADSIVKPSKLIESGYQFLFSTVESALRHYLA